MSGDINTLVKNYYLVVGNSKVNIERALELNLAYLEGLFDSYHRLDSNNPDYESDKSELEIEMDCVIRQTRTLEQVRDIQLNHSEENQNE